MNGASEILAARFNPLDGLLNFHRHIARQRFFGVDVQFAAESAAHFRRDHAHAIFFQAQHSGHERAHQVRNLRRGVEIELAIRAAPLRHDAACLHGHRNEALADDALLDHDVRFGERFVHVAAVLVIGERDVVRPLRMHGRRAFRERLLRIGDGGQNLVIHFNQIGSVAREVTVSRHNHGDRMADEVDAVGREDGMRRHPQVRHRNAARHGSHTFDVFASENADDAGGGDGLLGVNRTDASGSMRAAQNHSVVHARHLDVFDIRSGAGDEPWVLAAADALANKSLGLNSRGGHGRLLLSRARCGGFHCVDDVLVSRAATDVALEPMTNLVFGGGRIAIEDLLRRHDHAGRAESALEAVLVPERFLHGIELAVARETFHGDDIRALRLHGKHGAALDGLAVQLHGARAAQRGFAAHVRTRQARDVAHEMNEQQARFYVLGIAFPIDGECDVHNLLRRGRIQRCRRYQNSGPGAPIIRLILATGAKGFCHPTLLS